MLWKCLTMTTHSIASASPSGSARDPPAWCAGEICMYLDPAMQRFLSQFTEEDYWLSPLFFVV
jgi:hypothetical protein